MLSLGLQMPPQHRLQRCDATSRAITQPLACLVAEAQEREGGALATLHAQHAAAADLGPAQPCDVCGKWGWTGTGGQAAGVRDGAKGQASEAGGSSMSSSVQLGRLRMILHSCLCNGLANL